MKGSSNSKDSNFEC
uniref:Uncharacterized protein n=1 Tax=Arundo donax TaxID=35708 RepID=A0A0A9GSB7_ARUDO